MNPEPDEEGDRICEECGCILPEKNRLQCEICQHENIEPKKNEEGDFLCEHCGSALDVDVSRKINFQLQKLAIGTCISLQISTNYYIILIIIGRIREDGSRKIKRNKRR